MKKFSQYVYEMEEIEDGTVDDNDGKQAALGDLPHEDMVSLFKKAWLKHREEVLGFLQDLGQKDPEFKDALKGLEDTDEFPPNNNRNQHGDFDEVKPSRVDSAGDESGDAQ